MPKKSLKMNYIINTSRILLGLAVPLITFPYASKILFPEGIGKVTFANSFVAYFVTIAMAGIPLYGVRECAKVRDDKDELSKLSHELLIINLISMLFSYAVFFAVLLSSGTLYHQKELFLLSSTTIVFSVIGMEWLYQAIEEYGYIAVRSLSFQVLYVILLLLMVRSKGDYVLFAALIVLSSVGSNVTNFIHARKHIYFRRYAHYRIKRHLKPILTLFLYVLSVDFYINLNTVMLGFLAGSSAVGLYALANKINKIFLTVIDSICKVLSPRISYYIGQGKEREMQELIHKSLEFVLLLSLPIMIGLFMLSHELVLVFSNHAFSGAALTIEILTPIVLLIAIANVTTYQIMIPLGKEKQMLFTTITGAVLSFAGNLILVPRFSFNGAAAVTVVVEGVVTVMQCVLVWHYIKDALLSIRRTQYLCASLVVILEIFIARQDIQGIFLQLAIVFPICAVSYFTVLLLFKNDILIQVVRRIQTAWNKKVEWIDS